MFRFALAILMLSASGAALAASDAPAKDEQPPAKVYEGSVGSTPIVMSLDRSDDSVSGNYFYRSKRLDINLFGDVKKDVLQLESNVTHDKITLKPEGSGYAGSLTTEKGKTFPVQLHLIGPDAAKDLPPDLPEGTDLYGKMRFSGLALKPQKEETIGERGIRWYVEPSSGVRLFRVETGYPAPVMETINKSLTRLQWDKASSYYGCPGEGGSGYQESNVKPYLSDAHVSLSIGEAWDCAGAAHPDEGIDGHTYDARTGKELELDDVLKFGKAPVPKKDSDAWYDYRSKTFAPALVALLKKLHPKEMVASHKEDDCNYKDTEVWSFPTWYFTDKGLYVGASFPRVARVCDNPEWAIIPYSSLSELTSHR